MGCGGEGPYGSVIQFVGVYLLLIEIIVPYLVLLKKKNQKIHTQSQWPFSYLKNIHHSLLLR